LTATLDKDIRRFAEANERHASSQDYLNYGVAYSRATSASLLALEIAVDEGRLQAGRANFTPSADDVQNSIPSPYVGPRAETADVSQLESLRGNLEGLLHYGREAVSDADAWQPFLEEVRRFGDDVIKNCFHSRIFIQHVPFALRHIAGLRFLELELPQPSLATQKKMRLFLGNQVTAIYDDLWEIERRERAIAWLKTEGMRARALQKELAESSDEDALVEFNDEVPGNPTRAHGSIKLAGQTLFRLRCVLQNSIKGDSGAWRRFENALADIASMRLGE
jgi:hypothetical protein